MTQPDDSLTVQAFQQHIHQRYYTTDLARGTPATFMWLIEEVGELATALNSTGEERDPANIEEEFADRDRVAMHVGQYQQCGFGGGAEEEVSDGEGADGAEMIAV